MVHVSLTFDEALLHRAHEAAALRGRSLSEFIVETLVQHFEQHPEAGSVGKDGDRLHRDRQLDDGRDA